MNQSHLLDFEKRPFGINDDQSLNKSQASFHVYEHTSFYIVGWLLVAFRRLPARGRDAWR
jgi:hypothetical protein